MMDVAAVRAHDKNPIMCSSCEDKLPAAARCIECMDFLCHDCRNAHMRLRLTKTHRVSAVPSLLPWSFGLSSPLLLNPLLAPVLTENIWRPNTVKHCLLSTETCWRWTEWPNSIKHVWSPFQWARCFTLSDQIFVHVQILSNKIKHGEQTDADRVCRAVARKNLWLRQLVHGWVLFLVIYDDYKQQKRKKWLR